MESSLKELQRRARVVVAQQGKDFRTNENRPGRPKGSRGRQVRRAVIGNRTFTLQIAEDTNALLILDLRQETYGAFYDEEDPLPISLSASIKIVEEVLPILRQHMVLDDLGDVL